MTVRLAKSFKRTDTVSLIVSGRMKTFHVGNEMVEKLGWYDVDAVDVWIDTAAESMTVAPGRRHRLRRIHGSDARRFSCLDACEALALAKGRLNGRVIGCILHIAKAEEAAQ